MNKLKEKATHLKPLNKVMNDYNEFWNIQYFDYNPTAFRISSYGGGSYFNVYKTDQHKKQDGYIPMLDIQTYETSGFTLIELNNENAQRLYEEQPIVYEWLEYVLRRENQDGWEGFGWGEHKEYCHGIGSETLTGVYAGSHMGKQEPPNKLILCFGTGGGEAYDQKLLRVIRIKPPYDDFSYVWEFISDYCSPSL